MTGNDTEQAADSIAADPSRMFEGCCAAIIGLTLKGTIVAWNPAAERLYGYEASAIIGQSVLILCPPNRPPDLQVAIDGLQAGSTVEPHESLHKRRNDALVDVFLSISPTVRPTGEPVGAVMVVQDITVRKQDELERLELIAELTSALSIVNRWEPPRISKA